LRKKKKIDLQVQKEEKRDKFALNDREKSVKQQKHNQKVFGVKNKKEKS